MKFEVYRNPYGGDIPIFLSDEVDIQPGITVIAGCNGYGKTTMLHTIMEQLTERGIPFVYYDNMRDGGDVSVQGALWRGDTNFVATSACSSEGERILMNVCRHIAKPTGKMFANHHDAAEYFLLLDAVDSGLSIDKIEDIKEFLYNVVLDKHKDKEVYILVSTNSYEFGTGFGEHKSMWLDPHFCQYTDIDSYDDYKQYVMMSRRIVDYRYKGDEE